MFDRIFKFITSLRLTVVLLVLGFVLVFLGTMAQEPLGLYGAQARFFQSFFIDWPAFYASLHKTADMLNQGVGRTLGPVDMHQLNQWPRIPVFPGGYLIGFALLINLFAAHLRYYQPGTRKIGIALIHLGVVMLLIGQLLTDVLAIETNLHLRTGQTKNYTESSRQFELAVTDTANPEADTVVAIDARSLSDGREIRVAELPFTIRIQEFYPNSAFAQQPQPGFSQVNTTAGFGNGLWWRELPLVTEMDKRDIPSTIVEIVDGQKSIGSYFVTPYINQPQMFQLGGRLYRMEMRPSRFYKPYSIQLVEFRHDKYPGTEIPKNFSSRVRVMNSSTSEDREVLIYMNNPLRYQGETFYQSGFDPDNGGTVLQVVRNPSWLTPYLACIIVGIGMCYHFLLHLINFVRKRHAS